ncbi:hypothetical protein AB1Y20_010986 [Prymnesium parvum]|uniref:Uncharacterized protein n=1 Tax=Prymnesium parvum TaxID=97485 RepID=A0AB34IP60_PRYPA
MDLPSPSPGWHAWFSLLRAAARSPPSYCNASARLPCALALQPSPADLLGAQLSRRTHLVLESLRLGCHLLYTPLAAGMLPAAAAASLDALFALGDGCALAAPLPAPPPASLALPASAWAAADGRLLRLYGAPASPLPACAAAAAAAAALRTRLRPFPPSPPPFPPLPLPLPPHPLLHVAVHVRRGDLSSRLGPAAFGRWVPDAYYASLLPRLAALLASLPAAPAFLIVSQNASAWSRLAAAWRAPLAAAGAARVAFLIDAPPLPSLRALLDADVLVAAPSAFSSLAAAYSAGVLLAPSPSACRAHALPPHPKCTCRDAAAAAALALPAASLGKRARQAAGARHAGVSAHGCALLCEGGEAEGGKEGEGEGWNASEALREDLRALVGVRRRQPRWRPLWDRTYIKAGRVGTVRGGLSSSHKLLLALAAALFLPSLLKRAYDQPAQLDLSSFRVTGGQFARTARALQASFPSLKIEGGPYTPPPAVQYALRALRGGQLAIAALFFGGEAIFAAAGRSPPALVGRMHENKLATAAAVYGLDVVAQTLKAINAFEITYNGRVLHSKLETGRFPDPQELAAKLQAVLAEESKAAETASPLA